MLIEENQTSYRVCVELFHFFFLVEKLLLNVYLSLKLSMFSKNMTVFVLLIAMCRCEINGEDDNDEYQPLRKSDCNQNS